MEFSQSYPAERSSRGQKPSDAGEQGSMRKEAGAKSFVEVHKRVTHSIQDTVFLRAEAIREEQMKVHHAVPASRLPHESLLYGNQIDLDPP